ncbi:MAG: demethylmenaquinone methyltransferase/2-methoxy-6-polyprenyl-1,4-benzoquinol methylase [Candidatus Omnitrophota bacterium]
MLRYAIQAAVFKNQKDNMKSEVKVEKNIPQFKEIRHLFDQISPGYDKFNKWTSLGRDEYWRQQTCLPLKPGMAVLDIGTGTGDLAFEAYKSIGTSGHIDGLDFAEDMLAIAEEKRRAIDPAMKIQWIAKSAEDLPLTRKYDAIISAFVLRNLNPKIHHIIDGVYKTLKPGGVVSFVDLTEPENWFLRLGSRIYMKTIVMLMGVFCFGTAKPVSYLQGSMQRFFRARKFRDLLIDAGFEGVEYKSFLFGAVTHYLALKPNQSNDDAAQLPK